MFGAISGSSVAMAAAMGVIAIPEMRKRGYPDWLSGGLVATAGGIAMLIPPSIILILYGIVTETSVVRLFFAGVIPGLMLAVGNIITVMFIAWYLKLPRGAFDLGSEARLSVIEPASRLFQVHGGVSQPLGRSDLDQ